MNVGRRLILLTVLGWLGASPVRADNAAADAGFAAQAPVTVQPGESLQRLRLPLAVLQATRRPGWADLRLLDATGTALPWAWADAPPPATPPAPRRQALLPLPWPAAASAPVAPAVSIEWRGDGGVLRVQATGAPAPASANTEPQAWLLDLRPLGDERPASLQLDWAPQTATGLVLAVRAEASTDAQQWQPVGQAVLVEVAAPSGRQLLQARVDLAPLSATQRFVRLVADAPWPLRSAAAEFQRPAPGDDSLLDRTRLPLPASGELDLGVALPLRVMDFTLPAGATVLPLAVDHRPGTLAGGAPGQGAWWPLASHTAYRLQQGGRTLQSPPLRLEGPSARHWRVRAAGAGAGALPTEVDLAWRAPQLVFVASGRPPYRLAVGRADAADAALPLASLMPGYRAGDEHRLPQAQLGPLQPRTGRGHVWDDATPEQRNRWVLWAALAATVLVLAGLAWRLVRDMGAGGPAGPPAR